jgi:HAD superfamily hydrolase (TIGR01509 family)
MGYTFIMGKSERIPIDLLVFDFDGTLADSIPPAVEAIQAMLAELGYPSRSKEEIDRHVGYGENPLVAGSIGTNDPEKVEAAKKVYFKHYVEKLKHIDLYPHVEETIRHFKNKTRIIVSNKRDEFIRIILDHHGLTSEFKEILGGDSAPCLKPDPCVIEQLKKKYKVPPERILFVGDMTVDVETGKNAGVRTCAVTYGMHDRKKLEAHCPDFLIEDLSQLKNLML